MTIPFTKAHGARNDFLLTWRHEIRADHLDMPATARAICDRYTGVGADGWIIIERDAEANAKIELWNSDGSRSEISGNGTRCAAAFLIDADLAGTDVRIATGAGLKHLRLLNRDHLHFAFEMNMGAAKIEELHASFEERDCVILNVGNPQCAFLVDNFDFDWVAMGARIERHPHFPNRTNVSFTKRIDSHNLDVRFFERGAGETMSSGTGSTGAAAAAFVRGLVTSPVTIQTPAEPLVVRWADDEIFLTGPVELTVKGEFLVKNR